MLGIDTECDPGLCLLGTPSLAGETNEKWPLPAQQRTMECSVKGRTAHSREVKPRHLGLALKDAKEFARHERSAAKAELGVSRELIHSSRK